MKLEAALARLFKLKTLVNELADDVLKAAI